MPYFSVYLLLPVNYPFEIDFFGENLFGIFPHHPKEGKMVEMGKMSQIGAQNSTARPSTPAPDR